MLWKDLLYFSKGERRALILLLVLIVMAGILLVYTDYKRMEQVIADQRDLLALADIASDSLLNKQGQTIQQVSSTADMKSKVEVLHTTTPPKEKLSERVQRLSPSYAKTYKKREKYPPGTVVDLNSADTTSLMKVPGIGPTFSKRIVKFRTLLRGYYSVEQLTEVYGMDEERYSQLKGWFTVDTLLIDKMNINRVPEDSLWKHPYVNFKQSREILRIRKQQGRLDGWEKLRLLEEFTPADISRLSHYFSFD